jgi:hypothetical protein
VYIKLLFRLYDSIINININFVIIIIIIIIIVVVISVNISSRVQTHDESRSSFSLASRYGRPNQVIVLRRESVPCILTALKFSTL